MGPGKRAGAQAWSHHPGDGGLSEPGVVRGGYSPEVPGPQELKTRAGPSPRAPGGSTAPGALLGEHVSVVFLLCLPPVCGTLLQKPQEKTTHPLKIFKFFLKTDRPKKAEKLYPRVFNLSYTVT